LARRVGTGFALGRKLAELGGAYLASVDQIQEFYDVCHELEAGSDETIQLAVLDGIEMTYLARHDGRQPVRLTSQIGRRLPASVTATGSSRSTGRGSPTRTCTSLRPMRSTCAAQSAPWPSNSVIASPGCSRSTCTWRAAAAGRAVTSSRAKGRSTKKRGMDHERALFLDQAQAAPGHCSDQTLNGSYAFEIDGQILPNYDATIVPFDEGDVPQGLASLETMAD